MKLEVQITSISCPTCCEYLYKRLMQERGVERVSINYATGIAFVEYDEAITPGDLMRAIRSCGFDAVHRRSIVFLPSYAEQETVEAIDAIKELPEVIDVFPAPVSPGEPGETGSAPQATVAVLHYPVGDASKRIFDLARQYDPMASVESLCDSEEDFCLDRRMELLRVLVAASLATAPLLMSLNVFVQLALATFVQFVCARRYYASALRAIRCKKANMDTLVVLSTSTIYLFSVYVSFTQTNDVQVYFLAQCLLISLVLLGSYLENLAREQAGASLRSIEQLKVQQALVPDASVENGVREASAFSIRVGDAVLLRAGYQVPFDCILDEGACEVDESMLNGESALRTITSGDSAYAGTYIARGSARAVVRLVEGSELDKIIECTQNVQNAPAPIQRTADRIAGYFIPLVLALSVCAFVLTYFVLEAGNIQAAILRACSVLIVSCPCAFSLAVPTAIMVATGRGADLGIYFRSADQFERGSHVATVVFDKTGTLSEGSAPTAQETESLKPGSREAVSRLKEKGVELWLASGDEPSRVTRAAGSMGIENWIAQASPIGKLHLIKQLQGEGKVCAMVGDGVNDAPALAQSDISFAMGTGCSIASKTAGICIPSGKVVAIDLALRLARETMRTIRGNLVWAFAYNLVCIPLAMFGVFNPSICAAAMAFSSITVLMRSLKLRNACNARTETAFVAEPGGENEKQPITISKRVCP